MVGSEKLLTDLNLSQAEKPLIDQALTHSSYAYEQEGKNNLLHNERLEFLGDAALELVISEYFFNTYPDFPEGKLTKLRATVVCEDTLVKVAKKINIGIYLKLGKGETASGGAKRPSLLSDVLEAVIGAIYIAKGYQKTKEVILELFKEVFFALEKGMLKRDYKTIMQEYMQEKRSITPEYRIIAEKGPEHDKIFTAQFLLNKKVLGEGCGKSKKEAEQEAAQRAFERLVK